MTLLKQTVGIVTVTTVTFNGVKMAIALLSVPKSKTTNYILFHQIGTKKNISALPLIEQVE